MEGMPKKGIAESVQRPGYGLEDQGIEIVFLAKTKGLSSFPQRPEQLWGPHSLLFDGYRCLFLQAVWPDQEIDHSPPSNAQVKIPEACYHSPCLHAMALN
jgi:hypothetical protein